MPISVGYQSGSHYSTIQALEAYLPARTRLNQEAAAKYFLLSVMSSAVLLFGFTWWAPLLLGGAWLATHYLLRESSVWRDRQTDEVRSAQRDADYAYRLAVDPPAAKELRLFGLAGWTIDRFGSGDEPYTAEAALAWVMRAKRGESPLFTWHRRKSDGE